MKKLILMFGALMGAAFSDAAAQERAIDLHFNYSRGTVTETNSWGAGGGLQLTWGAKSAPLKVGTSFGGDYLKQEDGGPGTASASVDLTFQPGGATSIIPYAGVSGSENWSIGTAEQWGGGRFGREVLAGLQYKPSPSAKITWKAEERYGYIDGQEHTLATRAGILVSF
jgi:hypothetical protein